ncbi:hypothetical protein F5Y13DRAFT_189583 [Hypoxylon sp. FL1857]|nr:hypothetical protein F5Y13DRAFT_189583 [Hypoxylon sp. FL1857]
MSFTFNLTTLSGNGPNARSRAMALTIANSEAVFISNRASQALEAGRFDEAVSLHQEALTLKLRAYPEFSIQAGISFNGLGEALMRTGRLDEADECFQKALAVREAKGPAQDAAATRDATGALREAQGRFDEAREVRLKGAAKKQMLCGNYDCPTNKMSGLDKLSACSACKAVFYCSKSCQKQDWTNRHKPLCKARNAATQTGDEKAAS